MPILQCVHKRVTIIIVLVNQLAEMYAKHAPQNYNSCLLVVGYNNKTEKT